MQKYGQSLKNLQNLFDSLSLLWKAPREFAYHYTYPTDEFIIIKPYNPRLKILAKQFIKKINHYYPNTEVLFHGSAALGIAGQDDIDLLVPVPKEQLSTYLPGLTNIFGTPTKIRPAFAEWSVTINQVCVDVLLIDPRHPLAQKIIKTFNALKHDKKLLESYVQLKIAAHNLPYRDYERKKLKFFVTYNL